MTVIRSYKDASEHMQKAKDRAKGKPLGTNFRLYDAPSSGGIAVHTKGGYRPFAIITPDNTLTIESVDMVSPSSAIVYSLHKNFPFYTYLVSRGHYRLLPELQQDGSGHPMFDFANANKDSGYRLMPGLSIDLETLTANDYEEFKYDIDPDLNKVYRAGLSSVKRTLKTMCKLGAFSARLDRFSGQGVGRWEMDHLSPALPDSVHIMARAIREGVDEDLQHIIACHMYRKTYHTPTMEAQLRFIDSVFSFNSTAIRRDLGVIRN